MINVEFRSRGRGCGGGVNTHDSRGGRGEHRCRQSFSEYYSNGCLIQNCTTHTNNNIHLKILLKPLVTGVSLGGRANL